MKIELLRARAKDNVDTLDNLAAYLDPGDRAQVVDFVTVLFLDIDKVMLDAVEEGEDPILAYRTFVTKFRAYWDNPPL